MIAYLENEPGGSVVEAVLLDPAHVCTAHAVNLCEVYYDVLRNFDPATADEAIQTLKDAGIEAREDMDENFWKDIGFLKVTYPPLAIGDCFCLALARRLGTTVVTADHREMDKVAAAGIIPILFIR
jgi:PIN domain nuclease of toxin-antitoxin system